MLKRLFDILVSLLGLIVLSPFLILVSLIVGLSSKGGVFYFQERVGIHGVSFKLFKFRTMRTGSEKKGLLTVGGRDPRVTRVGYYLRKYKIDELPQLLNVLFGSMSLVGPRPEVRKYVDLYSLEQKKVLNVKPGITDYASLDYFSENELLATSTDPEKTYIEQIMPAKLELNKKYISEAGLVTDLKIIMRTLGKIVS
ncbi:glycosyl transferase [Sphingobacteriaceae bacterium]|nr:glycosyl transferase [Sphingobacteriaceae bacterium]